MEDQQGGETYPIRQKETKAYKRLDVAEITSRKLQNSYLPVK